jgi:hypothetical protein
VTRPPECAGKRRRAGGPPDSGRPADRIGEDVALRGGGGEVDGFVLNRPSLSFRMTCTTGFDQRRRAAWRP